MNKDINANINQLGQSLGQDISSLNDSPHAKNTIVIYTADHGLAMGSHGLLGKQNIYEQSMMSPLIICGPGIPDRKKSQAFTSIIEDVLQSVVSVGTDKGLGSGVVIDDRGFIVTNYHVVNDANIIRILTYSGDVYDAALIGYNDIVDVAVLKVDASLEKLRFGDSDAVEVGERVIALGNPAGLSFTVTEGIVSAVDRTGPSNLEIYLQTDVPINPGNSGGPLVNTNSRIIGINNFKAAGFEGLGFAIESNTVKQVAEDIIEEYLQAE